MVKFRPIPDTPKDYKMPIKLPSSNKTKTASAKTQPTGKPEYVQIGRATIFATPRGDGKPMFEGTLELDIDEETILLSVVLFKPTKEGSKCVATGSAKFSSSKEAGVYLWINLLSGNEDSIYALCNKPDDEKGEPPIKISLWQDDNCEWRFSGVVSAPIPF